MSQIMVFWPDRETKMQLNVVYRLSLQIKMPHKIKNLFKKTAETSCREPLSK